MRLLFDENLSHRLVRELSDIYPDSAHVRDIGLRGADDQRIWDYAAEQDLLLTTKNTDFYHRSLVFGALPKVIWLRVGNASTISIAELLRQRRPVLRSFYEDSEATFLPLGIS